MVSAERNNLAVRHNGAFLASHSCRSRAVEKATHFDLHTVHPGNAPVAILFPVTLLIWATLLKPAEAPMSLGRARNGEAPGLHALHEAGMRSGTLRNKGPFEAAVNKSS